MNWSQSWINLSDIYVMFHNHSFIFIRVHMLKGIKKTIKQPEVEA